MRTTQNALYRCEQIRACEQFALATMGFGEHELMERAGAAAWDVIHKRYPRARSILVFCGSGNNAGDGYVLARHAHLHGLQVLIIQCKPSEDLPAAAAHVALLAQEEGIVMQSVEEPLDCEADLIIDALLGIGLKGEVQGLLLEAVNQINASDIPVISLDVPSGLNADSGKVYNVSVNAQLTITFIGIKTGLLTADGLDYCGEIHCCDLGLQAALASISPYAMRLSKKNLPWPLSPRLHNSHKGQFGHVLIIGGGEGMPGSVALAAKAALRSGAGSVTVATLPDHARGILANCPEAMVRGVSSALELAELLSKATVCVLGPGLGEDQWAQDLFHETLTSQLPMVIDASALHLLALFPQKDDNWILTPHPGEAAALLNSSTLKVQQDRYAALRDLQTQYGGTVVLKGAGTLIQTNDDEVFVCNLGNPGMASAGMGDVLSGIIAALAAQGLGLAEAGKLGVWIHGVAGDLVADSLGERGLLASDLMDFLPKIINGLLP